MRRIVSCVVDQKLFSDASYCTSRQCLAGMKTAPRGKMGFCNSRQSECFAVLAPIVEVIPEDKLEKAKRCNTGTRLCSGIQ